KRETELAIEFALRRCGSASCFSQNELYGEFWRMRAAESKISGRGASRSRQSRYRRCIPPAHPAPRGGPATAQLRQSNWHPRTTTCGAARTNFAFVLQRPRANPFPFWQSRALYVGPGLPNNGQRIVAGRARFIALRLIA